MTFAMLQSLITPVLAEIQTDLHSSQTTVTWLQTAYFLSASVFTPVIGRIGDKVGKERMLVVTLVVVTVGLVGASVLGLPGRHPLDILTQLSLNGPSPTDAEGDWRCL